MAKPSIRLIEAMRNTVQVLESGASYQWGHMGSCNCGHLAQQLTHLSKSEIHERAMIRKGDWNEQCDDFCSTSGLPIDDLIGEMLSAGLSVKDLKNLEKLSDREVLKNLPSGKRYLKYNNKQDLILYLKVWAKLLEDKLADEININASIQKMEV